MAVPIRLAGSPAPGVHVQVHPKESPREKLAVFAMATYCGKGRVGGSNKGQGKVIAVMG